MQYSTERTGLTSSVLEHYTLTTKAHKCVVHYLSLQLLYTTTYIWDELTEQKAHIYRLNEIIEVLLYVMNLVQEL